MSLIAPAPAAVQAFIEQHRATLERANAALESRTFFEHFPESLKAYPEDATALGQSQYQGQLHQPFKRLIQPSDKWIVSDEVSPYTQEKLGISYPAFNHIDAYISHAQTAYEQWRKATPETRAGLLVEGLERLRPRFLEIAFATMHTTGQGFMMSFQASGPHAADRALEAVALGYAEQSRIPAHTSWTKAVGKSTIALDKYWRIVPKGIALSIGCSTFPVWNSLPGIFASLITGNVVIVKPHPLGIYSIAIVVAELQQLFQSVGFDPNIIQLATDHQASPITKTLCEHPAVQIIDYTGGSAFGDYIEALPNKTVFTEKAGVNSIILDSVADINAVMQNLAFSVNLYSGQMCTCPQNFFIPKSGIQTASGPLSYDETVAAFIQAIKGITENPKVGPAVCGAIQNPITAKRVADLTAKGAKVLLESQPIANPEFPNARTASPLVLEVAATDLSTISEELFGPIVLIIPTDSTTQSVELAQHIAASQGAISCGAYTTDNDTLAMIADKMTASGTPVSFNLTGQIFVNQNAAFSDFHVTGANPAGNATFTDAAFVARRFNVVGIRVNAS